MTALDMDRIREALAEDFAVIEYTESTGSTNTDLMQADKVADGTVLLANEQRAGKGRLGRHWVSPAGSQLIFSVLILPESLDHLGTLPLAAGLAVTDSVDGAVLKWPNDVHIDGKKLCGILAEAGPVGEAFKSAPKTEVSKAEVSKAEVSKAEINKAEVAPKTQAATPPSARVVVGMGINVTLSREELPIEAATSLALEGRDTDRTELAITVLKNLRRRISQWEKQDPQLMADYRTVCSSIGQEVRLEAPAGNVTGTVEGVADDGRINVGGDYYSAGDVIHLRPAAQ
ncbi:biotin--[acetyl-CoA-carboxylase] ligase [Corynebacterium singulare]|uniref:biotin--[biotin carboxyl-carrier protein] ligase n=1 Tax=Corynebacterium singulare TaxID=161899 RepID=A0ABS9PTQ8_9CORY|nr:biotin--[acetyl-CoA-carboxylase] ligase [Corynebacterium singulare]MCG7276095.1 biotin--[acetyl-CoA-carboxylase] ligase [Corynebacterium singulare]